MGILDKIDEATFKVVDGAVLWAWNEFGLPYRQIMLASLALSFTTGALSSSHGGKHYDLPFWLFVAIVGPCLAALGLISAAAPTEVLNASRLHTRCGALARLLRFAAVVTASLNFLAHDRMLDFFDQIVWLECLLMLNALIPTKPRNKKRREARATNLAWSPT